MRPTLPSWMTPVDRDILELLQNGDEQELILTPGVIAVNVDWNRGTVRQHLQDLRDHDMVAYYDEERTLYKLTDRGHAFLDSSEDPHGKDFDDEG